MFPAYESFFCVLIGVQSFFALAVLGLTCPGFEPGLPNQQFELLLTHSYSAI
jgi:hypothetical protein